MPIFRGYFRGMVSVKKTFEYTLELVYILHNMKLTNEEWKDFTSKYKNMIYYLLENNDVDYSLFEALNSTDIATRTPDSDVYDHLEKFINDLGYFSDRWGLNRIVRSIIQFHRIDQELYDLGIKENLGDINGY